MPQSGPSVRFRAGRAEPDQPERCAAEGAHRVATPTIFVKLATQVLLLSDYIIFLFIFMTIYYYY